MSEIDILRSSVHFLDSVAAVMSAVLLLGAIGPIVIEFSSLISSEVWKARVRFSSAVLLIAGTGIQITAQLQSSAKNSRMVAILDGEAAKANKSAGEAHERAEKLEVEAARLKLLAAQQAVELEKLRIELSNVKSDGDKTGSIARKTADDVAPRRITDAQSTALRYAFRGNGLLVTIVSVSDAEARGYAKEFAEKLLRPARFRTQSIILSEKPPYSGVAVCGATNNDLYLSRALRKSGIENTYFAPNAKDRPSFCGGTNMPATPIVLSDAGSAPPPSSRGTRIFIGDKPDVR